MTHGRCRSTTTAGALALALVLTLVLTTGACSGADRTATVLAAASVTTTSTSTTTTLPPTTTSTSTTTTLPPTTTTTVPSADTIAGSVVRVYGVNARDRRCLAGSAVVVSADGLLLTNQHVVAGSDTCVVVDFVIAVAPTVDAGVVERYRAGVVAADETLDLALLRIDREVGGQPVVPQLAPATLGDAGTLQLSDPVRAFGYPTAGSDPDSGESTITVSTGTVIGFLDERKWIKIDADIAPGSSGGGLFDAAGRLVGVPTRGFVGTTFGQARSVNLAAAMIATATAPPPPPEPAAPPASDPAPSPATDPPTPAPTVPPTVPRTVPPTPAPNVPPTRPPGVLPSVRLTPSTLAPGTPVPPLPAGFSPAGVTVRSVEVSPGKADGRPVPGAFRAGLTQLCVFWRTTGLAEGAPQRGRWYLDGVLVVETWLIRKPGLPADDYLNWCLPANAAGPLPTGSYRFTYDVGTRNLIDVRAVIT